MDTMMELFVETLNKTKPLP